MEAIAAQGIAPAGPVFSHHFRMDPETFDFEVGVPVPRPVAERGRVQASELPAAIVARTVYRGPYEGLGAAWGEFMAWMASERHEPASNLWECYVAGPESDPDPPRGALEPVPRAASPGTEGRALMRKLVLGPADGSRDRPDDFRRCGARHGADAGAEHDLPRLALDLPGPRGGSDLAGVIAASVVHMLGAALAGLTALFLALPWDAGRAGAAYLGWLAWEALRPGARSPFEPQRLPPDRPHKLFLMGFVTNLLNPKVAMFYIALFPQFIDPGRGSVLGQSLILGAIQMSVSFSVNPADRAVGGRDRVLVCAQPAVARRAAPCHGRRAAASPCRFEERQNG